MLVQWWTCWQWITRGNAPGATPVRATSPMISWILSSTCKTTTSSCPNPVVIMEWFVQCIFCFHFQVKTFSFNFSYYSAGKAITASQMICPWWMFYHPITPVLILWKIMFTLFKFILTVAISLLLKLFFFLQPFLVVILGHVPEYLHTAFRGYYLC